MLLRLDVSCLVPPIPKTLTLEPFVGTCAFKLGGKLLRVFSPENELFDTWFFGIPVIHFSFCFRNIIHGSDSVESAKKEIDLWFSEKELVSWTPAAEAWIYED